MANRHRLPVSPHSRGMPPGIIAGHTPADHAAAPHTCQSCGHTTAHTTEHIVRPFFTGSAMSRRSGALLSATPAEAGITRLQGPPPTSRHTHTRNARTQRTPARTHIADLQTADCSPIVCALSWFCSHFDIMFDSMFEHMSSVVCSIVCSSACPRQSV